MASQEEKTNILGNSSTGDVCYGSLLPIHQGNFTVCKRRWYILLIFSICSAINALKWNTWGPIQGTCQVVFGWSDITITMLVAWSPIVSIVVFLPMSWLMDVKGEEWLQIDDTIKLLPFVSDNEFRFRLVGQDTMLGLWQSRTVLLLTINNYWMRSRSR